MRAVQEVALETGQARSGDLRLALREHVAEHHLAVEGLHAVGLVVPAHPDPRSDTRV